MDRVLGARPPAGVRAPWSAVREHLIPAAPAHQPPDEGVCIDRVPARAAWKSSIARRSGSKATQIRVGIPPTFTIVSSMNMRRTSLGSAPMDPRAGPNLCTHPHIEAWLLLAMDLRALVALLSERPEKYG